MKAKIGKFNDKVITKFFKKNFIHLFPVRNYYKEKRGNL